MRTDNEQKLTEALVKMSYYLICVSIISVACITITVISLCSNTSGSTLPAHKSGFEIADSHDDTSPATVLKPSLSSNYPTKWTPQNEKNIPKGKEGNMIRYGKELLANTSRYFGPHGSVARITNGMNCQNCHLSGGTKLFGNNYFSFISSYPKFSGRSGKVEPATERISECFKRSLNGSMPDSSSKEIQSILAYMKWIGIKAAKGKKLFGNGTEKLEFLDDTADPVKGQAVFISKCQSCHGTNGEGVLAADKKSYTYPPLWGKNSYNDGAGMYRLANLAGFVKNNMPFGVTYQKPQLTDEEAWNVAAFVNSQPRPHRDQHNDWQDLKLKPIDFPFGPYADVFSEKQHKFGPFKQIKAARKEFSAKF